MLEQSGRDGNVSADVPWKEVGRECRLAKCNEGKSALSLSLFSHPSVVEERGKQGLVAAAASDAGEDGWGGGFPPTARL